VVKLTVTELVDRTFFAELEIDLGGETHVISCRPSDGVALAVRTDAPIFANEAVLDEAGQIVEEGPITEEESEELLDEFKRFIEDVAPEDFDG